MAILNIPRSGTRSVDFSSAPDIESPSSAAFYWGKYPSYKYPLQRTMNAKGSFYDYEFYDGSGFYYPTTAPENFGGTGLHNPPFIIDDNTMGIITATGANTSYVTAPYSSGSAPTVGPNPATGATTVTGAVSASGNHDINGTFHQSTIGPVMLSHNGANNNQYKVTDLNGTSYNAFNMFDTACQFYEYGYVINGDDNVWIMHKNSVAAGWENPTNGLPSFLQAVIWRPTTLSEGGSYNSNVYDVVLGDTADNDLLAAATTTDMAWNGYWYIRSNTEKLFLTCMEGDDPNPMLAMTVFEFEPDLSSYIRIDVNAGDYVDGLYVRDVDGGEYLLGTTDIEYNSFNHRYIAPAAVETPIVPGQPLVLSSL